MVYQRDIVVRSFWLFRSTNVYDAFCYITLDVYIWCINEQMWSGILSRFLRWVGWMGKRFREGNITIFQGGAITLEVVIIPLLLKNVSTLIYYLSYRPYHTHVHHWLSLKTFPAVVSLKCCREGYNNLDVVSTILPSIYYPHSPLSSTYVIINRSKEVLVTVGVKGSTWYCVSGGGGGGGLHHPRYRGGVEATSSLVRCIRGWWGYIAVDKKEEGYISP